MQTMKRKTTFAAAVIAAGLIAAAGCARTDTVASVSGVHEIGCAKCSYGLSGAETCVPAARVGDGVYLLDGEVDMKAHALCEAPRSAVLRGTFRGDRIHAETIEVED